MGGESGGARGFRVSVAPLGDVDAALRRPYCEAPGHRGLGVPATHLVAFGRGGDLGYDGEAFALQVCADCARRMTRRGEPEARI